MYFTKAKWIWIDDSDKRRTLQFRKEFFADKDDYKIAITADARYALYLNGTTVGYGPVKAFDFNYKYDIYDLTGLITKGKNVISIIATFAGESSLQHKFCAPGLMFEMFDCDGKSVLWSDNETLVREDQEREKIVPFVSHQSVFFEEQYDARKYDGWKESDYVPDGFAHAVIAIDASKKHSNLTQSDIPVLSRQYIYPKKIFAVEGVVNEGSVLSIDIREYLLSANDSSKHFVSHFYLMCEAVSDKQGEFSLNFCEGLGFLYINGENFDVGIGSKVKIKKGRNIICFGRRCVSYGNQNVLDINGVNLKFGTVYLIGPLPYSKDRTNYPESEWGETVIVEGMDVDENTLNQIAQSATACDLDAIKSKFSSYVTDVSHLVQKNNIFHQSLIDKVVNKDLRCQLKDEEALFGSNSFLTIYPHKDCDIRLLIDYGGETLGYQTFECVAQEGTILDFHNFEFIQPDLRRNYAETMNNSFRYICKEGYQKFEAMVSKGFRYVYITIRNQNAPVKLKNVCNIETVYPQSNKGDFICSDWKLNRIYECCKNTLRCCSQDTYVDCPTYEQVFWVGDARNEAIVDWLINGDSRLWYHCLRLAGDSLNVSPLVQSHTPTGWDNIITAWSALWHRSVYEYMLYTGDYSKAQDLRALLLKDIEGIKTFINKDGLYEISAWNLFDWAVMDTPKNAVVTHQNFFVIFAIDYTIKFLRLINEEEKTISELEELKDQLKAAINKYLWSEEKQAFADCLRYGKNGERILSSVFSQQTHTIAYISKGTTQERLQRCYTIVTNPPSGFVVSGSPFFEFFRLEVYSSTKQYQKMYQAISDNWGFMIDAGSDTFWELWSGITLDGRMTRSHCHAWSCAPVYFLTEYILGVSPLEPGYSKVKIKPYAGTLKFCRGVVPTPHGEIRVSWKANDGVITDLQYSVPKGVEVVLDD